MSDIVIVAALVKSSLLEIGKQEMALGEGLLSAAPGTKTGVPNNSVQYLLAASEQMLKLAERCNEFLPASPSKDQKESETK